MTTGINQTYNFQGRILKPLDYQQLQQKNKPYAISMSNAGTIFQDVTPVTQTTPTSAAKPAASTAADGCDDGSIGFWSATGNLLKGVGNFFKGMFCDENGDFSIAQTFKTALIAGAVAAATFIPVVGPLVVPTLCAIGMAHGGSKVLTGIGTAMSAKTDAEAEKAWQEIGEGATEGAISYYGYKASGGFKQGWEAAKADWATLRNPVSPTGGAPASGEPVDLVEGVDYVEVTEEAANTAAKPSQAQLEAKPSGESLQLESKPTDLAVQNNTNTTDIIRSDAPAGSSSQTAGQQATHNSASGNANTGTSNSAGRAQANNNGASTGNSSTTSANNMNLNTQQADFIRSVDPEHISSLSPADKAKLADILEVRPSDLGNLTKAQYRQLQIKFHPDKNGNNPLAEQIIKIVNHMGYKK